MGITVVEVITSGPKGDAGTPGTSTEVGGTTGQVLRKVSNANFDAGWGDVAASEVTFTSTSGMVATDVNSGIDEVSTTTSILIDASRYVDKSAVAIFNIVTEGLYTVDTGLPNGWLTGTLEVLKTKGSTLVTQVLKDASSGLKMTRTSSSGTGGDWTNWSEEVESARITANTNNIVSLKEGVMYTVSTNTDVDTIVTEGLHIINNYIPSSLPTGVSSNLELMVNKYSNDPTYTNKITQTLTDVTNGVIYTRSSNDYTSPVWSVWSVKLAYNSPSLVGSIVNATVPTSVPADLVNGTGIASYTANVSSGMSVSNTTGAITVTNTGKYRYNLELEMLFGTIGAAEKMLKIDLVDTTSTTIVNTSNRFIPANATHFEVTHNSVVELTAAHSYILSIRSEVALTALSFTSSVFDIESILY